MIDFVLAARILELSVAGGLGAVVTTIAKYWSVRKEARMPTAIESTELAIADKAVIAAGHQLDAMAKDNERLRATLLEERSYYEKERSSFAVREAHLRAEIDRLEAQLKAVLREVQALKQSEFGDR